ncbi:MAG: HlyD family type I secretion periplasmic adaptor subunit, partial [Verrucomicrobiota bacterium]
FKEATSQRDNLVASIARLQAEAAHKEQIVFPEQIQVNRPDLIETETQLFASRRESVEGRIAHLEKSLAIKTKELEITRPLAADGIVSQIELLRLENAENDIQGQIIKARTDYLNQVLTERNELNARLEQINETLRAYRDKITRSTLRSPVRGIVNKVHFSTPGSVIRPSEPIIEIVPVDDTLLVEARISPADIAFIGQDQKATVKLTAYDFSIYGGLEGTVEQISADTFEDERGESYYEIKVRTGGRSLRNNESELEIMPGMTVEVDIKTGKKTILEYLLKPLLRAKMNSFSER